MEKGAELARGGKRSIHSLSYTFAAVPNVDCYVIAM